MAGQKLNFGNSICFIDYHDGEGSANIGGKKYRWEFHEYLGPTFLRKDGEPLVRQPSEKHPVWKEFDKWLVKYKAARKTAKESEVIRL